MNKHFVSAFVTGLIFGMGLLVSGMANPDRYCLFWTLQAPGIRHWRL